MSNIPKNYAGWNFSPLNKPDLRTCQKIDLAKYINMHCNYKENLLGNNKAGINLSKEKSTDGWYRFIYADKNACQDSLDTYNANEE